MAESQSTTVSDNGESVEYREVPDFPGYRVGSDGSVWSCLLPGGRRGARRSEVWRRRKTSLNSSGYPAVSIRYGGSGTPRRQRFVSVHILVMRAFVGPPPEGMEVAHNDGDKLNCRLTNLRYDTPTGNNRDKERHGTKLLGEKNPYAKLTAELVRAIRSDQDRTEVVAKKHNIHPETVRHVRSGRRWGWLV